MELPKVDKVRDVIRGHDVDTDPSAYETEPRDLGVGISIQNLTKIYDTVREYHHLVCNVSIPAVFLHFTAIGLISCIVSVWLHCKYSSGQGSGLCKKYNIPLHNAQMYCT